MNAKFNVLQFQCNWQSVNLGHVLVQPQGMRPRHQRAFWRSVSNLRDDTRDSSTKIKISSIVGPRKFWRVSELTRFSCSCAQRDCNSRANKTKYAVQMNNKWMHITMSCIYVWCLKIKHARRIMANTDRSRRSTKLQRILFARLRDPINPGIVPTKIIRCTSCTNCTAQATPLAPWSQIWSSYSCSSFGLYVIKSCIIRIILLFKYLEVYLCRVNCTRVAWSLWMSLLRLKKWRNCLTPCLANHFPENVPVLTIWFYSESVHVLIREKTKIFVCVCVCV